MVSAFYYSAFLNCQKPKMKSKSDTFMNFNIEQPVWFPLNGATFATAKTFVGFVVELMVVNVAVDATAARLVHGNDRPTRGEFIKMFEKAAILVLRMGKTIIVEKSFGFIDRQEEKVDRVKFALESRISPG